MKQLINGADSAVVQAISGLVRCNPSLQMLDGFPDVSYNCDCYLVVTLGADLNISFIDCVDQSCLQ